MFYVKDQNGSKINFDMESEDVQFLSECANCNKELTCTYEEFFEIVKGDFCPYTTVISCGNECERDFMEQVRSGSFENEHMHQQSKHTEKSLTPSEVTKVLLEVCEKIKRIEDYICEHHDYDASDCSFLHY